MVFDGSVFLAVSSLTIAKTLGGIPNIFKERFRDLSAATEINKAI